MVEYYTATKKNEAPLPVPIWNDLHGILLNFWKANCSTVYRVCYHFVEIKDVCVWMSIKICKCMTLPGWMYKKVVKRTDFLWNRDLGGWESSGRETRCSLFILGWANTEAGWSPTVPVCPEAGQVGSACGGIKCQSSECAWSLAGSKGEWQQRDEKTAILSQFNMWRWE